MSADRHILIPDATIFTDPVTKERVTSPEGKEIPSRNHQWYLHTYVLSHPAFSQRVGGFDVVFAGKQIAKAVEKAFDAGSHYYTVSSAQRDLMLEAYKAAKRPEKGKDPEPPTAMESMSNFEAFAFCAHAEAIQEASLKIPEDPCKEPELVGPGLDPEDCPDERMIGGVQ